MHAFPPASRTRWFLPVLLAAVAGMAPWVSGAVPEQVRFNEHIRPILSNACFHCHGPDDKTRDADLRLDTREGAIEDRDGVRAIVPGKPDESEIMLRVASHDRDEMMPPPKAKKERLTDEQIATLRRWIEQGAQYEGHWAFLPLLNVEPPSVKETAWPKNGIDQFILARLEREGIAPSPEADRHTLLRRVSLDLTGLLPSPEETRAFVEDKSPDAYEQLVERLLASPHYGERWGRHWLDQARYADSNGYTIDSERVMWPFRDWVIKAHNEDIPFDRFTIEQLAGDLLPKPTKNQLIATAFHRNTLINEEGGTNPEQFRVEAVMDRTNTTGTVWLGLTVGCAQCHTHKFDPITHREYYQMYAFFNQGEDVNNKGATIEVARGEVFGGASAEERRKQTATELKKGQPEWEKQELARSGEVAPNAGPVQWSVAKYLEYDTPTNAGFQLLPDNSLLADGGGSFNDTYRVVAKTSLKQVAAVRLRVLTHDSLPQRGPGFASNGNFVLTEFKATIGGEEVSIARTFADHEQPGYPAAATVDGESKTGWAINVGKKPRDSNVKMNADHDVVFVFDKPITVGDVPFEFRLHHDLNEKYLVGRFAIDFAETAPTKHEGPLVLALRTPPEQRTADQAKLVSDAFTQATAAKGGKSGKGNANGDVVQLMVMRDLPKPRPTHLFQRGDFLRPDEKLGPLQPGVIAAVNDAFENKETAFGNRLDLARWLVSPQNPLTPRVTMNRIWMRYFGRGIVETDEDFGSQGAAPTHPELLDCLSREFVRQGWSMKAMHRLIVTSATYRQASKARPDLAEKDPRNLLLARQERIRLEAEIIRDAALSASGLLERVVGGPSVRPPQPEGVYSFTQTKKQWKTSTGADRFRRGLYTTFFRSAPHPLFTTFDAPDFQTTCTRRARSNTPLQALTMANDEAFFELAQGLAARVLRESSEGQDVQPSSRLKRAFALAICREPSPKELEVLQGYFEEQAHALAQNPSAITGLVPAGLEKSGISQEEAAALVCAARAILNTDSFITRE